MTALSYDVDEVTCTATVTYYSQPTFAELRRVVARVITHSAFQPDFAILFNRRRVYTVADAAELNTMVRILDEERSKGNLAGPCGLIVNDPASYEVGKMAEQISTFVNSIRTFHQLEDAERWVTDERVASQIAGMPAAA